MVVLCHLLLLILSVSAPGAQITHRLLESTVQVHDVGPTTKARSTPLTSALPHPARPCRRPPPRTLGEYDE
jgi:hypothetical protein